MAFSCAPAAFAHSALARQLGSFAMVGWLGFAVDLAATLLLAQGAGLAPVLAKPGGIFCGLLVTFTLNRRFTFRSRGPRLMREFRRYALTCAAAQGVNFVAFSACHWTLEALAPGLSDPLAIVASSVFGSGLSACVTFTLAKLYAFR